jgi:hypothetical protein
MDNEIIYHDLIDAKIYRELDGKYFAIEKKKGKSGPKRKYPEQLIEVIENEPISELVCEDDNLIEEGVSEVTEAHSTPNTTRLMPIRKYFDELYNKHYNTTFRKRKKLIYEEMRQYFHSDKAAKDFVAENCLRRYKNVKAQMRRLERKIALNAEKITHFATFTYDSEKLDEDTFKRKLINTLSNLKKRKGWEYVGVWERGGDTDRLHFHALLAIPDGGMPDELEEVTDYNFKKHRRVKTFQCAYFTEKFGRNDFKKIESLKDLEREMKYLIKYITKTGNKLVYSRGMFTYMKSDVMEQDIICPYNIEDPNGTYILSNKFNCITEGEIIGEVSADVKDKMPKCN